MKHRETSVSPVTKHAFYLVPDIHHYSIPLQPQLFYVQSWALVNFSSHLDTVFLTNFPTFTAKQQGVRVRLLLSAHCGARNDLERGPCFPGEEYRGYGACTRPDHLLVPGARGDQRLQEAGLSSVESDVGGHQEFGFCVFGEGAGGCHQLSHGYGLPQPIHVGG